MNQSEALDKKQKYCKIDNGLIDSRKQVSPMLVFGAAAPGGCQGVRKEGAPLVPTNKFSNTHVPMGILRKMFKHLPVV